ncbi:MAG: FGGY-family carbohydrate kinase [Lachnospiraceae bacterium]|nr:FGGY-family carbohydrate kinase [Lachnospiraceae bacterium]
MGYNKEEIKQLIEAGKAVMGIEFGSTRIKAVLVDDKNTPIASGSHEWENHLDNGIWTYPLSEIHEGFQDCYKDLKKDVMSQYGVALKKVGAIGISAMMHGYVVFDKDNNLLVPFRTWRNTITEEASEKLTELFGYNIPQRWSIAHLYQAMLKKEPHVKDIAFQTTLAGYIHWMLTGKKVMGVGEASGMFPIDINTHDFDETMVSKFDKLVEADGYSWRFRDIFPKVLVAGEDAGTLTAEGAKFLDPTGELEAGVPVCPPEGDAGTGMVATNAVKVRTGNVSAGTSVFAMVVLEKNLSKVYPEIDLVTTPSGDLVGMVHCNNCTSDLNAWVGIFKDFLESYGMEVDMNKLFGTLYNKALEGDKNCGGLLSYNYFSGEGVTKLDEGRPLFVREQNAKLNLANFMRTHLYASLSTLKLGCDIMLKEEGVKVDSITGHGGLFKTKGVGQSILAAALNAPVSVMETAGEGGAWGMALLASYMINKANGESLEDYLSNKVFVGMNASTIAPDADDVKGFDEYLETYKAGLAIEKAAINSIK